ncbi:MAG: TetR/AcrR family transcriptional regulator [Sulfuriferula multivorans]|uniref:TetR/AcrR family transcriptional regulator n=1 Tax=Sulfuriferula multivorans TaxID=1559896 RepID=A0A7C9P994_9PROT|nr:TetR/AcrR family transcriptional regulator [Sulfuriferula multivorans]
MNAPTKNSDMTRQKLLESAFSEIHRNGFQAASLSQILADTQLTKGALYHHFPDKKALGLAVIEEVIRPSLADMMFTPLQNTNTPLAALQALLRDKADIEEPTLVERGCPLGNLIQEMSPVDEAFRLQLNALFKEWVTVIADALKRGQQSGEVDAAVETDETAFFIVSSLEGCIGMSKNTQSFASFRGCLAQLGRYLDTLKAVPVTA